MFLVHAFNHKTHAHVFKRPSFNLEKGQMSNMYKIKGNFLGIFVYEWYDMMFMKISLQYDKMHSNDVNYVLKPSMNKELNS